MKPLLAKCNIREKRFEGNVKIVKNSWKIPSKELVEFSAKGKACSSDSDVLLQPQILHLVPHSDIHTHRDRERERETHTP